MDEEKLMLWSRDLRKATMSDSDLIAWAATALQQPGLPDMLVRLKRRILSLSTQALRLGDTENKKAQIAELELVINMFEHFNEYTDTETETAEG